MSAGMGLFGKKASKESAQRLAEMKVKPMKKNKTIGTNGLHNVITLTGTSDKGNAN